METILQSTLVTKHIPTVERTSVISKFMSWCKGQEKNRLGWLGAIFAIHGCVLTPLTLFAIILSGTYFPFYIAALVAMGMTVVTNLAAMPTKVTIPVFFLSILIDIAVVIGCFVIGFNPASTQI